MADPPTASPPRLSELQLSVEGDVDVLLAGDVVASPPPSPAGSAASLPRGSGSGASLASQGDAAADTSPADGSPDSDARRGDGGAGGTTEADTDADAAEDADRLGFFGGDTLLSEQRSLDTDDVAPPPASLPRLHRHAHAHAPPDSPGAPGMRSPGGSASAGGGERTPSSTHDNHEDEESAARPLPFEFLVLDAALDAVCTRLEDGVADVEAAAGPALDALAARVSRRTLEDVKRCRGALARLQARVQTVRAELQRLLDDDSDMRDMYLSRKAAARAAALRLWLGVRGGNAPPATPAAHVAHAWELADAGDDADIQELEDLLETYFAQIDHCYNRLDVLKEVIQDTEDYVNIDLDSKRNKILEFNVVVGLAAVVHGVASCAYGVFGMNFLLDGDGEPTGKLIGNVRRRDPQSGFVFVSVLVAALCVVAWLGLVWGFRRDGFIHIVTLPFVNKGH